MPFRRQILLAFGSVPHLKGRACPMINSPSRRRRVSDSSLFPPSRLLSGLEPLRINSMKWRPDTLRMLLVTVGSVRVAIRGGIAGGLLAETGEAMVFPPNVEFQVAPCRRALSAGGRVIFAQWSGSARITSLVAASPWPEDLSGDRIVFSEFVGDRALARKMGPLPEHRVVVRHLSTILNKVTTHFHRVYSSWVSRGQTLHVRLYRARQHIDSNYYREISLEELANLAAVSPTHLHRRFKAAFGQTPNRYRIQRRMLVARSLLRATRHAIGDIGHHVGYEDFSAFTRMYRSTFGCSPSDERAQSAPYSSACCR